MTARREKPFCSKGVYFRAILPADLNEIARFLSNHGTRRSGMSWQGQNSKNASVLAMNSLRGDSMAMDRARRMLCSASPSTQVSLLNDEQVLQRLAQMTVPRNTVDVATLSFDGRMLHWRQVFRDRIQSIRWRAVSGRSGYQTKEHQGTADKGPIPAGAWLVAQGKYQQMPQRSLLDQLINELGRGAWPGGESSWGQHRIWLQPKEGTNTYGRSGFSIHGGDTAGSAGCIDLVEQMPDFVKVFRAYGHDVDLTVKYD
jgi:hypothetical protein